MSARTKILIILIGLIIIFLIIYWLGYMPVLKVNNDFVFKKDFDLSSSAVLNIQQNYPKIFSQFLATGDKQTLETLALTKLIENSLISQGLKQYPDAEAKVQGHLQELLGQFKNVPPLQLDFLTQKLYQMSFTQAEKLLFLPQAKYDVMQQELGNQDIRAWLIQQEKNASISIYLLPYQWNKDLLKIIASQ